VTAVADGKPYEVTTLRRDVETLGRHAVVAYTTDWAEDAARRDFTMNALYADEAGNLFDYHGGIADLAARRVRFVGDPKTRIREDYLRILRLFRFHAWYGRGEIDAMALTAVSEERAGLQRLSGERIQKELLRLLEADDPTPVLSVMEERGILREIFPSTLQLERLERLVAIDRANGFTPDAVLRLAAMLPGSAKIAFAFAARLRLSNADRDRLVGAADIDERSVPALTPDDARKLIYLTGADAFRDSALLHWAGTGPNLSADDSRWRALVSLASTWRKPVFPLDGNDVMALGVVEGPQIGIMLRDIEQWWIESGFTPDRKTLLGRLEKAVRKPHE
jgi:poly(A) polymerase